MVKFPNLKQKKKECRNLECTNLALSKTCDTGFNKTNLLVAEDTGLKYNYAVHVLFT